MKMITALVALYLFPHISFSSTFLNDVEKSLVIYNTETSTFEPAPEGHLNDKKFIAFYYSAHWCPPCRQFTPELVKTYNEFFQNYDNFELIFVSADKNEKSMADYISWGKMNFPALRFASQNNLPLITDLSADGIPYLVLVDQDGKEVLGKGSNDWVHPAKILQDIAAKISQ